MKKLILIAAFLFPVAGLAQITKTVIPAAPQPSVVTNAPFDSTKNWQGKDNVGSYLGQEIYILPKYTKEQFMEYNRIAPHGSNSFHEMTPYADIHDHTLKVVKIEPYSTPYQPDRYYLFETVDKETQKEYDFYYDTQKDFHSYAIVISHFNFLKQTLVGKEYVVLPRAISMLKSRASGERIYNKDINTGTPVTYSPEKNVYKCVDITVTEDCMLSPLIIIITNGEHTTYFDYTVLWRINNGKRVDIVEKEEWDKMEKVYGKGMMDCVVEGTIKVGMPLELVLLSWGTPNRINRSFVGDDQYVYGHQYVYISKQGKVTAWNES